ncbi:flavin reductase family protein [Rhizobium leguminosarum]|uniref:flavin reductase family protein n=1 Tax=Rhizobium leguminosarum TaxID=384 RepID=UPI001C98644A|nr:flavin reductase family protein [Rhizobium leguminosarum]MBY5377293.1 flavin reductase [Rhizobium leguminosarum]
MLQQTIHSSSPSTLCAAEDETLVDALKSAMRQLASGVAVVTTSHCDAWHGMTATSLTSLSMEPPSMLVCINREATIHSPLMEAGTICVNLLSSAQEDVCALFASKSRRQERFKDGSWQSGPMQLPYHPEARASIFCTIDAVHVFGTHSVFFAKVHHVKYARSNHSAPMIYLDGRFIEA